MSSALALGSEMIEITNHGRTYINNLPDLNLWSFYGWSWRRSVTHESIAILLKLLPLGLISKLEPGGSPGSFSLLPRLCIVDLVAVLSIGRI